MIDGHSEYYYNPTLSIDVVNYCKKNPNGYFISDNQKYKCHPTYYKYGYTQAINNKYCVGYGHGQLLSPDICIFIDLSNNIIPPELINSYCSNTNNNEINFYDISNNLFTCSYPIKYPLDSSCNDNDIKISVPKCISNSPNNTYYSTVKYTNICPNNWQVKQICEIDYKKLEAKNNDYYLSLQKLNNSSSNNSSSNNSSSNNNSSSFDMCLCTIS